MNSTLASLNRRGSISTRFNWDQLPKRSTRDRWKKESEVSRRVRECSWGTTRASPRNPLFRAVLCLTPFSTLLIPFFLPFVHVTGVYVYTVLLLSFSLSASRSRGVSTRILVNTAGFSFHVGVRMLPEDITTGLACLTRFDAASLSVSLRARSLACPSLSYNNAHSHDFRLRLLLELYVRNCYFRRDWTILYVFSFYLSSCLN